MTESPPSGRGIKIIKYLRLLALLVGTVLELLFGWWFWWLGQEITLLWSVGAAIGALCTAVGLLHFVRGNIWLSFWLYLGLALFMPFYGALGSAAIALYLWRTNTGQLATQYADYVDAEESTLGDEDDFLSRGTVDQMVRHELNVQSYMDIMSGPDRILKKVLIGRILSEWTPNAVSLLKQGLKDPDYEIRSYSSTALTTIENRMNERILQLKKAIDEQPEDSSLRMKLGQSYLDYAGSGLLDPGSAHHYVHMVGEILDVLPAPPAEDDEMHLQILNLRATTARLNGDEQTEEQVYEQILERYPEHQETLNHLCALLFRQKRFSALRQACDLFLQQTSGDHPALGAARLWSSPEAASQPRVAEGEARA